MGSKTTKLLLLDSLLQEMDSIGGGTPRAEAVLEMKRRVLRNALKGEFIRKKYNPKNYSAEGGVVFDAAVQRWHALQFTYGDHFKPTFTNFTKFFFLLSSLSRVSTNSAGDPTTRSIFEP